MKVVCLQLISPTSGAVELESPWLVVGAEYHVLSILAVPGGGILVQILADKAGQGAAWFDSAMFMTSDNSIPKNWTVSIREEGETEISPAPWSRAGFWETYYDGDPTANQIFAEQLAIILATSTE